MSNFLLQLLSYFLFKKRPITITLAITVDYYKFFFILKFFWDKKISVYTLLLLSSKLKKTKLFSLKFRL